MVELFAGLPPDHEFFEQFSFISADDLPEYQAILGARPATLAPKEYRAEDRRAPAVAAVQADRGAPSPGRDRRGDQGAACWRRAAFRRRAAARSSRARSSSSMPTRYNAAASLQDNILFGKIAYGQAQAQSKLARIDRATCSTSWRSRRRHGGRARLPGRHRRLAAVGGAAPEARRSRARRAQAARPADPQRGAQRARRRVASQGDGQYAEGVARAAG